MKNKLKLFLLGISIFLLIFFLTGCDFTQYIAHYANMAGWTTQINIQNPLSKDVNVTLYVYDDDGNEATHTTVSVPARGFYKAFVQDVFSDPIPATGSIKMVSSEPGLTPKVSAIILFEYNGGPAMGGLQSFGNPEKVLNFPWFQNDSSFKTGIAILNVNPWPIQAVLKASDSTGNIYTSKTYTLNPMQRIIGYPQDFFTTNLPADLNLSVWASGKVAGFIILHNSSLSKVEAINGVPVIPFEPDFFYLNNTNLDLNNRPISMAVSKDSNILYASVEYPNNKILVIDLNNFSIIHEISMNRAGNIILSPDDKYLYAADYGDNKVFKISTSDYSKTPYTTTFTNVYNVAISNDGRYFAAANDTNYLVWDLGSNGQTIINKTAGDIEGIIFSEDSKYFIVIDYDNSKLISTELQTTSNVSNVNLSGKPKFLTQAPNNGNIYVGNNNNTIDEITYPGFSLNRSLTTGTNHYALAFSPEGRYLYAPSLSDNKLWIFDFYANDFKPTIDLGDTVIVLGSSHDGEHVYYAQNSAPYTLRSIDSSPMYVTKKNQK